jgi:hypothetical protein
MHRDNLGARSYAALQPFVGPNRYLNYFDQDDAGASALAAAYGPNVARFRPDQGEVTRNVFHLNVNIPPKA